MSVMFVIRLDKANELENGKFPIVLQITYNRKVRKKRLGLSASFDQWDFENHEFRKGVHSRAEYNRTLEENIKKAQAINSKHFDSKPFNYTAFITYFTQKKDKRKVLEFCDQITRDFVTTGQISSSKDYEVIKSAIKKLAPNDLEFTDITTDWLKEFEQYFHKRGANCFSYMKLLKALFMKAVEHRLVDIKYFPFKNPYLNPHGYDISHLKKVKIARTNKKRIKDLSIDDLIKVMNYVPQTPSEKKYMDLWFLSYYLFGVNFTDIANMQKSDIRNDRWYYSRSKTGVTLKKGKPLSQEVIDIIERNATDDEYIFDVLNGKRPDGIPYTLNAESIRRRIQDYAKYISKTCRRVSKKIGLDGYFTYYSARHTSATIALNSGADQNTVSKLMDHANTSTLDFYTGNVIESNVINAMQLLTRVNLEKSLETVK